MPLLWRVCKNGLPTLLNLQARSVIKEAKFHWCQEEVVDLNHSLLYYPLIKDYWFHQFQLLKDSNVRLDFLQVLVAVMKKIFQGSLRNVFL